MQLAGWAVGRRGRWAAPALLVGGATALATWRAARGPTLVPWPAKVRRVFPIAVGVGAGVAAGGTVGLGAAAVLPKAEAPSGSTGRTGIGASAATAAAILSFGAAWVLRRRMLSRLIAASAALDSALMADPAAPLVSAGEASDQRIGELGREGARFVHWTTGVDDAAAVLPHLMPRDVRAPIRVFVSALAAPTVEQRVGLAVAELRRLGAFDRGHLLIQAPAGTGYANSTPADVLEILTGGDCATVVVGYGLLPSFLSLGAVPTAARTQHLLFDAIATERNRLGARTRVLAYGESLGAKVQQVAARRGLADLEDWGVARALWVGTPGGVAADDFRSRCGDDAVVLDSPADIPADAERPRVWFLQHDGDPVVRLRPELLWRRPAWLPREGGRGRNVPAQMRFRPGLTYLQTMVDTLFATDVKPGDFQSLGHDYRADLGQVVAAAFQLPIPGSDTAALLDIRLRALELARAGRVGETA